MIRRLINNFVKPYRKKNDGLIVRPNDAPLLEQEMVEVKPEGQLWDILCLVAFGIIISGFLAVFLIVCDPERYERETDCSFRKSRRWMSYGSGGIIYGKRPTSRLT